MYALAYKEAMEVIAINQPLLNEFADGANKGVGPPAGGEGGGG